jgi:Ca2+-binding EF-hand superfamily protein
LLSSTNCLYCGLEHFKASFSGGDSQFEAPKIGVWVIPFDRINPEIAAQKQEQLRQRLAAGASAKQVRQALLAKYDSNHNGRIDLEEREAALDDPAFIESELDAIDANHNGRLDAAELAYFDANTNKILDPKEQAGIDIAQHLFAVRLMEKFDANGDGRLNKTEFEDLFSSSFRVKSAGIPTASYASFAPPLPDDNHDGFVDLDELETFLKRNTRSELRLRGDRAAMRVQRQAEMSQTLTPQQMFKMSIEAYWQKSGESSPETNQTQHP